MRATIVGDGPPRYSGYTAWRGVVQLDPSLAQRAAPGESWGPGSLFGIARLAGNQGYWYATAQAPEGGAGSPAEEKAKLLRFFGRWHDPLPELIEATLHGSILRNDLYDRPPLDRWTVGRIALLGDAAHPMLPNLGQGACQAIEDAAALADALAGVGDVEEALLAYGERRAPRAAWAVRQSRQMCRIAHLSGPAAIGRNLVIRITPPSAALKRIAPIVGGDD